MTAEYSKTNTLLLSGMLPDDKNTDAIYVLPLSTVAGISKSDLKAEGDGSADQRG